MSYELVNQSTEVCRKFSKQFWAKALELAKLYGWQPKGTLPPAHIDLNELNSGWLGIYLSNDGQAVVREDSYLLAAALEKALKDIPDENPKIEWNHRSWMDDDLPEWLTPEEKEIIEDELQEGLLDIMGTHPLKFLAGDEKKRVSELIRFCRLGSFEIL